jgi:hypothetical protein
LFCTAHGLHFGAVFTETLALFFFFGIIQITGVPGLYFAARKTTLNWHQAASVVLCERDLFIVLQWFRALL